MALYGQVVDIAEDCLGPAAERFVKRQISSHLGKKAEDLKPADIPTLVEWIKVSLGLLTEDKAVVERCYNRLMALYSTRS